MSAPKVKVIVATDTWTFERDCNAALEEFDKAGHGIMQITYGFEAGAEWSVFTAFISYRELPNARDAVLHDAT